MTLTQTQDAGIALNRFGLGARPGDPLPADPRRWLLDQFGRYDPMPSLLAAIPQGEPLAQRYRAATIDNRNEKRGLDDAAAAQRMAAVTPAARGLAATPPMQGPAYAALKAERAVVRDRYRAAINARMGTALATDAPFVERLAAFWSNHFAISVEKPYVDIFAPDYENEAIRPHVLGRFSDMLLAVERHPAMLMYLDQVNSRGPNSSVGLRAAALHPDKPHGLNENLAREIMELHTLGVRSGYDQADVTEFARAMTGWTATGIDGGNDQGEAIGFAFRPMVHEPGPRRVMGRTYPEGGEEQARAILLDLATSPATARHLATKLARHFVADDPPAPLVDRLTASYLIGGGDLPSVYRTLVMSPEAWAAPTAKFKTPWDWSVSALRGLGRRDLGRIDAAPMLKQLGQDIWRPGQPVGFDDLSASWAAPDALMRRVELAQRFASMAGEEIDARALAPRLLPGTLTPATATALAQAESGPTALALLLVSPEFQRR